MEGGLGDVLIRTGIDDLYNVTYEFSFSGTALATWTSRYEVKGPKKDYVIENVYIRP